MPPGAPVTLLWTAGYDSTFRLLSLLRAGEAVRPIYVIDRDRPSYPNELAAMARLRELIGGRTSAPGLLLPLEMRLRDDFPVGPEVRAAFEAVAAVAHVGSQYAWLAQVCRDLGFGPGEVELCMQRHDSPSALQVAIFDDPHGPAPRLATDAARVLFGAYSFPVIGLSKAEMGRAAEREGFADILAATWFCHTPVLGKPCGRCAPCRIARTERPGVAFSRLGFLRGAAGRAQRRLRRALQPG